MEEFPRFYNWFHYVSPIKTLFLRRQRLISSPFALEVVLITTGASTFKATVSPSLSPSVGDLQAPEECRKGATGLGEASQGVLVVIRV